MSSSCGWSAGQLPNTEQPGRHQRDHVSLSQSERNDVRYWNKFSVANKIRIGVEVSVVLELGVEVDLVEGWLGFGLGLESCQG